MGRHFVNTWSAAEAASRRSSNLDKGNAAMTALLEITEPPGQHRRQGNPEGPVADHQQGRSARHHGAERLGQEHARERADGQPELQGHGRRGAVQGAVDPGDGCRTSGRGCGLFLAFQYPVAIPGVTLVNFLRQAVNAVRGSDVPIREFRESLFKKMDLLKVDQDFARRYVNDGFSGGEKKRAEMLQMAMLEPAMAVLDETDSGLDIDALRTVAEGVNALMNPEMGLLLITHYQRLLNYIKPQFVHVLVEGADRAIGRTGTGGAARSSGLRRIRSRSRGDGLKEVAMTTTPESDRHRSYKVVGFSTRKRPCSRRTRA